MASVPDMPSAEEMVAASPIAMLVLDPAGLIKRVNAAAEMLLNLSAQTVIGRQISDLLVMPDAYGEEEAAFAAYDAVIRVKRGAEIRADLFVTPLAERPGWKVLSVYSGLTVHRVGNRTQSGGARAAIRIAAMRLKIHWPA